MTGWPVLAAVAAAAAALLATARRAPRHLPRVESDPGRARGGLDQGLLRRWRALFALLAGSLGVTVLGGTWGVVVAVGAAIVVWVACTTVESPAARHEREAARRGLPYVTRLLAVVLAGGQSVPSALAVVAAALPGPASAPLARACSSLGVGVATDEVWAELATTPGLEPLGRALQRASESGARVADVVERLATRLAAEERAGVEDRARTVGIRAAVPLGLCLLPSFLLLGIVPVVAGALSSLQW
ncbi:type II secretion system F family protein [Nocardioides jiangxiensis]|uniref:Type II secretion system F family protein n=1 Tax=Nocardioides jiangxiensis TaxID=3064524 RepID=A0ABT9B194_9ACTN|nr:type II secretion system F family protein [Nocardioides sp. WY-20]MDO7868492.1 type II secretion system F family protein [Nocardioides sp. WY-20]